MPSTPSCRLIGNATTASSVNSAAAQASSSSSSSSETRYRESRSATSARDSASDCVVLSSVIGVEVMSENAAGSTPDGKSACQSSDVPDVSLAFVVENLYLRIFTASEITSNTSRKHV